MKFAKISIVIRAVVKADTVVTGEGKIKLEGYRNFIIFKNDIPAKGAVRQPQIKPRPDFYSLECTAPQLPGTMPEKFIGLRFSMGTYFFTIMGEKVVITEFQINCFIQFKFLCRLKKGYGFA